MAQTVNVQYVNDFAALPSTAPPDHAHVVDIATFRPSDGNVKSNVKLQDAVVTMLYQISPDTLSKFLNSGTRSFRLVNQSAHNIAEKLVIIKKGNEVLASESYTDHTGPPLRVFEFDNLARMRVDQSGKWTITYGSYGEYVRRDWDQLWNGQFVDVGMSMRTMVASNDRDKAHFAFSVADYILANSLWDASSFNWTITGV
ncbi:hypothetical protein P153DRAFT_412782 [Dothidotthia symphoricarpi CBS 119687]|uniref:Uncharacterized protein n=1 Tax=Dothidotthia symphoricarpi CBS 119687 TaxID=1392245 RepID=A0A6A6APP7_9PLEO|nr:uncharacterized protein P153DRAFT_412782 [Dothidotthia symphoricarpi CBS 119687]KAF2133173.1 hypothetical protein P153DRAFT_412782 [Dothidotthia symphoricarpi CBS 119687]